MKKFFVLLLSIFICFLFPLNAYAAKKVPMYVRVDTIGSNLMEKNNLHAKIKFKVKRTNKINAYANSKREIYVFSGLIKLCDNDDELAGIISHEIGHIVNKHIYKMGAVDTVVMTSIEVAKIVPVAALGAALVYGVSRKKWSRMDEFEADVTGVDLMVGAGYNPLAMVSVLQKITKTYKDFISTHPSGEKRTMYIYDYICYTYPQIAQKGYDSKAFDEFMVYAEPIIKERNSNSEKLAKFNEKQAKLQAKRKAKYAKYVKKKKEPLPLQPI